jgi:hypothetical protein
LAGIRPLGPSAEDDRRRYESEQNRRAHEEAAAARHYLNMAAAAARSNPATLIHRPAQSHPPPTSHGGNSKLPSAAPYSTSAASIHYPTGHRVPMGPQKDPGPPPTLLRTNGTPVTSHHSMPPSASAKQHPGNPDPKYPVGFKPYEIYTSRSSSTSPSPGAHLPHAARQPQQQSQPQATIERHSNSPRYGPSIPPPPAASQRPPLGGSPVPNQFYGKPVPMVVGPAPAHTPGASVAQTPPPAHGGSTARPAGPPPERPVRSVEEIPAPIPHSHQEFDLPLDLGLPAKRRADDVEIIALSPKKMLRIEPNAQLFKVSEPSVLQASEPSIITTVVNSALTSVASSNDRADTQSETSSTTVKEEMEDSNDCGYVHKLKKAWIKSYSSDPVSTLLKLFFLFVKTK